MRDIGFMPRDYAAKMKAARTDIPDLASLKKLNGVDPGTAFLFGRSMFVWLPNDTTPDDGVTSLRPEGLPPAAAGRYRRATVAINKSQVS